MKATTLGFLSLVALLTLSVWFFTPRPTQTVRVGVLHSLSGTMSMSEKGVADVTLAAFNELNARGGIMGHQVRPILADGASHNARFASEAEALIRDRNVKAIFGCWTSSSRKEVKRIVEQYDNLLFYPVQYEGFEASPNIVYLGQTPNQQIRPAVKFAMDRLGKTFYLVGSDYIFPRAANFYIKDIASMFGITIAGEAYVPLGSNDFAAIVETIRTRRPAVIFSTLNGDRNFHFFKGLYDAGIDADRIPVISLSIGDTEIRQMGEKLPREALVGHYAALSYFATIDSPENLAFGEFLRRNRIDSPPSDAMEGAYNAVQIYKQAVEECQSFDPRIVRRCLPMQSVNAPGGVIYLDATNNHAWKKSRIARINGSLDFDIVFESPKAIRPQNYPPHRPIAFWNDLMKSYHHPRSPGGQP